MEELEYDTHYFSPPHCPLPHLKFMHGCAVHVNLAIGGLIDPGEHVNKRRRKSYRESASEHFAQEVVLFIRMIGDVDEQEV